jgi:hypothetical protein
MSTNDDPRRSIAAWLEAEAPDRAPTRLIETSRERIRTTRQRSAWLPTRRTSDMNSFAKLAIAAAAVVVVALVGYNLLPNRGGVGSAPASPSPSSSPSPSLPTGPIEVTPSGVLPGGALLPGTYTYQSINGSTVDVRLTVPAGWINNGILTTGTSGPDLPAGVAIAFWAGDIQVYGEPCQWQGTEPDPPTGPTARDVVDALAAQPQRDASTPIERRAPGATGPGEYGGWSVELSVPVDGDLVGAPCDNGEFRSWGPEENARYHQGPGQRDVVWVIDAEQRIVVDFAYYDATPQGTVDQARAIIDSMVFGQFD